jgi:hypothetical protein
MATKEFWYVLYAVLRSFQVACGEGDIDQGGVFGDGESGR